MKPRNDAALILCHYLQQETDLLDGHRDPTDVVPHWFYNHNKPKKFTKPRPEPRPASPEVLIRIKAWDEDPCFDLANTEIPEEWTAEELETLQYYETAVKEWAVEKYRWELAQDLILFRKWIYWLTRFTNMDISDRQVMQFAGLIPPDEEDLLPPDEE